MPEAFGDHGLIARAMQHPTGEAFTELPQIPGFNGAASRKGRTYGRQPISIEGMK